MNEEIIEMKELFKEKWELAKRAESKRRKLTLM